MRSILWWVLASVILLPAAPASAQQVQVAKGRAWQGGMRGDLPVRVHFFSSSPSNALDSAAVHLASKMALFFSGYQGDTRVSIFPIPDTVGLHVQMEVNVYSGGEIRYSAKYLDASGKVLAGCGDGAQFSATEREAALVTLSHQMRTSLECARTSRNISQLLPKW